MRMAQKNMAYVFHEKYSLKHDACEKFFTAWKNS